MLRTARRAEASAGRFVILAMILATSVAARVQQEPQSAKQEVRDNLAPHPAPAQPLPYSHKAHLALGLTCKDCHSNPQPGNLMTFPATAKCMQCHAAVATDKPAIQKLAEFAKSRESIPWVRVYQITPGVNWSHRTHLQAGMQCAMCHGDVSQLDAMSQTTSVTAMGTCIACHQAHNAPTVCSTCHSWPAG